MLDLKVRNFHLMFCADFLFYFILINTSFVGPIQGLH